MNPSCLLRSRRKTVAALFAAMCLVVTSDAIAEKKFDQERIEDLLRVKARTVQHMALNPVLVRAVRAQNQSSQSLDQIKSLDASWREDKTLTPFKLSLQTNQAGSFLKSTVERLQTLNEAFVTDNQGANVAAFPATSDYWQGDEEKWSASFNGGNGQLFMGALELDESTQTYAVQISAPVLDRGETIGVLVVGVTIDYLEAKGG